MVEEPVTISLASISGRISSLHLTVESLLTQDYPSCTVRVHLSDHAYLLDEGVSELPGPLSELARKYPGKLEFRWVRNIGSYRKLLPVLVESVGRRRLIATADDDTLYPPDWLSRLVEHYDRHRCIICYRGHRMVRDQKGFVRYRRWMTSGLTDNPDVHILPTGKDGILYDSSFFHPAVLNHQAALSLAPTADDIWFRWHTAAFGVPVFSIYTDYTSMTFPTVSSGPSLYTEHNRGGTNDETIRKMIGYGKRELGLDYERYDEAQPFNARRVLAG